MVSYCSANEFVLEAILEQAKRTNRPVLIEATANQVNQFGGYTGMKPKDFQDFVGKIAEKYQVSKDLIILGGDHLGPLTWVSEPEEQAMEKSEELVKQYVLAGFTKIHLDTSMKLGDDAPDQPLSTEVIAQRGVRLYQVAMEAFAVRKSKVPEAVRPVFVIGSEVPIPGGAQEAEEGIAVTTPEDFVNTVNTYQKVFKDAGCSDAWSDIVAVVVQPGVEFGDAQVFLYERSEAAELCGTLKQYPTMVLEGHSTDYQSRACLREMVEDGIAILKVGPALTFGLREALFALSMIEKELIPEEEQSGFIEVLDSVMLKSPGNWQKHYHGNDHEMALARKYSFSDRCRYYMGDPAVTAAIEQLFANLSRDEIPMNILHQYMPGQFEKIQQGVLAAEPRELAKDGVMSFVADYEYAVY
jgi:D-tagatose-1,6-bisphosphate aldolase subunit GatZ/KbaZ